MLAVIHVMNHKSSPLRLVAPSNPHEQNQSTGLRIILRIDVIVPHSNHIMPALC